MLRAYVMLAVISAMIFLALGCQQPAKPGPEGAVRSGSTSGLWEGYGDVDTTARPKYRTMPPLKR